MTRPRLLDRILALLRHAEADTPEGRNAARIAARLRSRHGISDDELDRARALQTEDDRHAAPLEGWTKPWQAVVATMLGEAYGLRCVIDVSRDEAVVVLQGERAGRVARYAEALGAKVERRVASAGGDAAIRALPARRGLLTVTMWSTASSVSYGGYSFGGPPTLGALAGDAAVDLYRIAVAHGYLATARQARAREMASRRPEPPPARVSPGAPPAQTSTTGESAAPSGGPPSPEAPTQAQERTPEEARAVAERAQRVRHLLGLARSVVAEPPPWSAPEPPTDTALVPTALGAPA